MGAEAMSLFDDDPIRDLSPMRLLDIKPSWRAIADSLFGIYADCMGALRTSERFLD